MGKKLLSLGQVKYKVVVVFVGLVVLVCSCKPAKTTKTSGMSTTNTSNTTESEVRETKVIIPQLSEEDSLNLKLGQMILIGINDAKKISSKDSIVSQIAQNKIGSVILFEKNITDGNSFAQLKACIDSLQSKAKIPLFVSIDEEGGKVHRLHEEYGFVKVPSAMYLGKLDNIDSSEFYYNRLADQLQRLGINMNFAPSVDMGVNTKNPVIYKALRSYSSDPYIVTKHASIAVKAHKRHKVAAVIKHFPGHGSSNTDSHLGLTDVTKTWTSQELLPFKNLVAARTCDVIMTAHIVNCKLDSTCMPATLSKKVISGLLRDSLKFDGVIVSDDMQMYAISKNYGLEKALTLCINAGVDILLFGNNVVASQQVSASQLHALLKKLVKEGKISKERVSESYQRIIQLKRKLGMLP